MNIKRRSPPWIMIMIGAALSMYLGYLVGGAWSTGIQAPEFIDNFLRVIDEPFQNYFNEYTFKAILFVLVAYALVVLMYYTSRRNYMAGQEYGTAQFADIKAVNKIIADKDKQKNRILSERLRMSINTRLTKLNNNILVVGGSGAGKTFFFLIPNLMQLLKKVSFIITDSKGEISRRCGNMLRKNGYKVKVLNLIDMAKSDCYNPFVYIRSETDVIKLITNLMANTTPKGSQSAEPFWESATCS